ncbi:MAG: hypothetical protein AB3N23_17365 [Paracoccaceae bacterium]
MQLLAFALSAALAQISTNLDNLALLLAIALPVGMMRAVVGYVLAQVIVMTLAVGIGIGAGHLMAGGTGWLGLIPILLGVLSLIRRTSDTPGSDRITAGASVPLVVMLFLGLSMDSLAVMTPLLADSLPPYRMAGVVGGLGGASALAALAVWLHKFALAGGWLSRLDRVAPFIMIAAGVYVLWDSWTDLV